MAPFVTTPEVLLMTPLLIGNFWLYIYYTVRCGHRTDDLELITVTVMAAEAHVMYNSLVRTNTRYSGMSAFGLSTMIDLGS